MAPAPLDPSPLLSGKAQLHLCTCQIRSAQHRSFFLSCLAPFPVSCRCLKTGKTVGYDVISRAGQAAIGTKMSEKKKGYRDKKDTVGFNFKMRILSGSKERTSLLLANSTASYSFPPSAIPAASHKATSANGHVSRENAREP